MGLSNYLASSRISQSGVCTSTTRPASPYEGQVIYESDTDRVLVWNASAWVAPNSTTANPPGLELVKTQTIGTGVSSVTVTDAFSAVYDNYLITVSSGVGSTATPLTLQLGATTTNYYNSLVLTTWSNTVTSSGTSTGNSFLRFGFCTTNSLYGNCTVLAPYLASNTFFRSDYINVTNGGAATGALFNSTQYSDFTLAPASGTITGGTIRVYGYRN